MSLAFVNVGSSVPIVRLLACHACALMLGASVAAAQSGTSVSDAAPTVSAPTVGVPAEGASVASGDTIVPVDTMPRAVAGVAASVDTTPALHPPITPIPAIDSLTHAEPPRIMQEEYLNAGHARYTLNGKLPYRETNLQTGTAIAFGGALLALAGTITWYQQAWYPDSTKGPFQFQVDWSYAKEFDKVGHAFGGWMSSYCSHEAFIACGLSRDDAALWGAIGGLFFQTFIEVQDGFHTNYGFDWTDQLGNVAGSAYFYAQRRVPFLQNFEPKWSVGPTGRDSAREAAQLHSRLIVDDYDRQDVWLSVKVHNLLPTSLQSFWPKWLQLALGAGARDVELAGYHAYRVLHLSLDYDLVELLPDLGSFGNWLKQGLNAFHWPAPALRLWPTVKFELIYPFRL